MPDPTPGNGATEHGRDVVLHQEVGKALGAIAAGESDHVSGAEGQQGGGAAKEKCLRHPEATPGIA